MTDGTAISPVSNAPTVRLNTRRLSDWCIALAVFSGGFVLFEPAPYELLLAGFMAIFFLFGLRIHRDVMPVLVTVTLFSLGGFISSFMIEDYNRGMLYNAVTLFLGLTSVFFALLILSDRDRLRLIFRVYVVAAFVTSLLGILGYFGFPGMEMFTRYGRAQGAFADPNVFAPFMIPPMLYLIYGIMNRSVTKFPFRAAFLVVILAGIFLAYSRAAWGLAVFSGGAFYFLLLLTERKPRMRARYILFGTFGLTVMLIGILGALQIEAVSKVFFERAQLVQSYDGNRLGRFARHLIGFELATQHPFGIGSLEFGKIYGEDEHNVYLRALLSYGWLGFASFLFMVFLPLIAGFKSLFRQRPWQAYFQIAYVVFVGHLLVGWVIDIDHWRHFYLLLGVLWGCILLERRETARRAYFASNAGNRSLVRTGLTA